MTIDRKDWVKHLAEQQHPRAAMMRDTHNLHLMKQAAVPAEVLMADQHWAVYQQMLQGQVEALIANRDRLVATLMSDACSSYEDMTRVKRLIAECEATIRAFAAAIALPKQLLEGAEKATAELAAITGKYEQDDEPKSLAG